MPAPWQDHPNMAEDADDPPIPAVIEPEPAPNIDTSPAAPPAPAPNIANEGADTANEGELLQDVILVVGELVMLSTIYHLSVLAIIVSVVAV